MSNVPNYCKFQRTANDGERMLFVCENPACRKSIALPLPVNGLPLRNPVALCRVQAPGFKLAVLVDRTNVVAHTPKSLPCTLRREKAGTIPCPTCDGGTRQLPVYVCLRHRICTINPVGPVEVDGRVPHVCNGCESIQPPA